MSAPDLIDIDAQQIDDCWNRIGIHGDKSCPLLADHIHCRNCAVYASAAVRLLDRYALDRQHAPMHYSEAVGRVESRSLVLFRLADEWLALATRCLVEVAPVQAVHSLPHQRSRALRGVANVRGALVPCLALEELLGIDGQHTQPATSTRVMPRMLIIAIDGGSVVVPVEEVDGIHRIDLVELEQASTATTQAGARFTQGVLPFRGRSVRLLDDTALLLAMNRSLT
ncbi:chemotaxis protein CheW [Pseudomonas rhizosphaerae]|jgi:chemotaxis-related protein WspD|uniref:Chemotaxis protein CheW n=1 Tax=Pseudomonas rhizosphaerae TaxID=216142 RepID=A0A089ZRN5_9PSED|nr:chemotaxis protein CheW [Pseudomonas rhizosphaerae]AIS19691.1 chemotaxis protein CheW [Pseudomonas rhizosphaerae]